MVAPKGDYPVSSVAGSGCVVPNTRIGFCLMTFFYS
jgi:hypothetical protein